MGFGEGVSLRKMEDFGGVGLWWVDVGWKYVLDFGGVWRDGGVDIVGVLVVRFGSCFGWVGCYGGCKLFG